MRSITIALIKDLLINIFIFYITIKTIAMQTVTIYFCWPTLGQLILSNGLQKLALYMHSISIVVKTIIFSVWTLNVLPISVWPLWIQLSGKKTYNNYINFRHKENVYSFIVSQLLQIKSDYFISWYKGEHFFFYITF